MEHPIFQKIERSKKVDFGDVLTRCVELYKKVWQQGAAHVLITAIAAIPLIGLIYGPFIYYTFQQEKARNAYYMSDYSAEYVSGAPSILSIVILAVFIMIAAFLLQVVSAGVSAHFYKVCRAMDLETGEDTKDYFEFFRGKQLKRLLLLGLVSSGIAFLALLLCYLPIFYALVPLQLMVPIFAFNKDMTVSEIVKAAFKLGNKHWIYVFGFYIIASNVAQLGVILCFVGVIFTACIVYLPVYYFYKSTIGFEGISENNNEAQALSQ